MVSYTNPPWKVSEDGLPVGSKKRPTVRVVRDGQAMFEPICIVESGFNQEANARLIAAAPNLLDSVREMIWLLNQPAHAVGDDRRRIYKAANDAYTQATGEPPWMIAP